MTSFSEQPWEIRRGALGRQAEGKFEELYGKGFVRLGLDDPPIQVHKLHPYLRHLPDYLSSDGMVEVMGVGRDRTLKLKVDKLAALHFWDLLMPVSLWIWDSTTKTSTELDLEYVDDLVKSAPILRFPEGTPYYAIPVDGGDRAAA